MKLAQAMQLAEKESRENQCTVYLCAGFKSYRLGDRRHSPLTGPERPLQPAEVDPDGYHTCDFYDGTVIARCVDGKWREL